MADGASIHRMPSGSSSPTLRDEPPEAPAPETAERPSSKDPPASRAPTSAISGSRTVGSKHRLKRSFLFTLLPVVLIVGGYFYVTGGQIMTTDNAYVRADMLGVTTDVSGIVDSIEVHDNEFVKKGQTLFRLRREPFQIALDAAKAQLGTVYNQVLTLRATYILATAQIAQAEADLPYYQTTFDRQKRLLATGAGTQATFDQAQHDLEAVKQRIAVAKAQAEAALSQLSGDPNQPVESNPFYVLAKSGVDNAQRELNDSIVTAPFDGIVSNVSALQVGSYLQASHQAFSLISTSHVWVEASPKETELTYVRPGQPTTISVDAYPGIEWKGTVDSIGPASGASFSLLPAQNTTGNWVKVVQRIPVRVHVEDVAGKPPLRAGMSVVLDVHTGHARGFPAFIDAIFHRRSEDSR